VDPMRLVFLDEAARISRWAARTRGWCAARSSLNRDRWTGTRALDRGAER